MSDSQESCYHLSFPEPRPCLQGTQRLLLHCNNSPEKSDSKFQAVLSLCAKTDVILKKKLKLNGRNGRNRSMSIIKQFKYGTAQLSWFPWRRSAQRVVILCSQVRVQRLWAYSTCLRSLHTLWSTHCLPVLLAVCMTWQGKVQQLSHWLERSKM